MQEDNPFESPEEVEVLPKEPQEIANKRTTGRFTYFCTCLIITLWLRELRYASISLLGFYGYALFVSICLAVVFVYASLGRLKAIGWPQSYIFILLLFPSFTFIMLPALLCLPKGFAHTKKIDAWGVLIGFAWIAILLFAGMFRFLITSR